MNWLEDSDLGSGAVHTQLPDQHEIDFWKQLIEKYLHPLPNDSKHQAEVAIELKRLRNKILLVFIMFNLMYIVIVCMLQAQGVHIAIMMEWPCTMNSSHSFELEPIGLVLILFSGTILLLHFIGMLIHRRETFWHIMATTFVNKPRDNCRRMMSINYVHLAKKMQRLQRGSSKKSNRASVVSSRKYCHALINRKYNFIGY